MAVVIKVGETEAVSVDIGEKVYIQGDPGFSPTIEVSDITGGHRLTITDINGDKTVDVMNGLNGDTGNGIDYITLNTDYTMTVHYTNGTEWISGSIRGEPGEVTQVEFDALADAVSRQESDIEGKQDAPADAGTAGQVLGLDSSLNPVWVNQSGGGGATNYNDLSNKPQIEGVTLSGNKTAAELGLAKASDIPAVPVQSVNGKTGAVVLDASDVGALPDNTVIPRKTSDLANDSGFITASALPTRTSDLINNSGFVDAAGAAAAAPVQSVNGSTGAVTVQPTINANGILKGNGSGGVSAAVAGTDYLTPATNYSPVQKVPRNQTYALTASDIGKTILEQWSTDPNLNRVEFSLTGANSSAIPIGAEIAFTYIYSSAGTITFSGVRVNHVELGEFATARQTVTVSLERRSLVALKKLDSNTSVGDLWLLTGNVEVVS